MAITTVDGVIAGWQPHVYFDKTAPAGLAAGKPVTCWASSGVPGPGSYDTTLNGVTLSSSTVLVDGQIPHYDPGAGINAYLARFNLIVGTGTSNNAAFIVADRLWHSGGIDVTNTGVQSITSPVWPARDALGGTSGVGVWLAIEESAVLTSIAGTTTVKYTSADNVSNQSATITNNIWFSATLAGCTALLAHAAGDRGVKSVQSIQLSSNLTAGTINLVAYRVLLVGRMQSYDVLRTGMPRLFNGTVPYLMFQSTAISAIHLMGSYIESRG